MLAPTHPMQLALGLIVWSIWFIALYGGLSVGCAISPPAPELGSFNWLNLLLGVFTAVVLAWLLRQMVLCWRQTKTKDTDGPRRRFIAGVSASAYAVAAISTIFIGLPVMGLPPCL